MIVVQIRRQQLLEMALIENDHVVEKLSTKAPDDSLHIRILPRRGRRRDDFVDTQRINPSPNPITVYAITVS
jgi:hypothetical protein